MGVGKEERERQNLGIVGRNYMAWAWNLVVGTSMGIKVGIPGGKEQGNKYKTRNTQAAGKAGRNGRWQLGRVSPGKNHPKGGGSRTRPAAKWERG